MPRKTLQNLTVNGIEKLLNQQTVVILNAVDEKLSKQQRYVDYRISLLEKRLGKMEIKMNQNFNRLTTTLDKFLKRLTDIEDEFEAMKLDINRLKKVIREKLGVELI